MTCYLGCVTCMTCCFVYITLAMTCCHNYQRVDPTIFSGGALGSLGIQNQANKISLNYLVHNVCMVKWSFLYSRLLVIALYNMLLLGGLGDSPNESIFVCLFSCYNKSYSIMPDCSIKGQLQNKFYPMFLLHENF